MKAKNLVLNALCVTFFAAGCTALEPYVIDAPDDLADKIAQYQDEKNKRNQGDTTYVDLASLVVGADDNSSAWWTEFSQYFAVPSGKKLVVEFVNYGTKANNWNNWNVCLANGERDGDGYSEYFVLRSDAYGWGNADYNGSAIEFDYGGQEEVNWDEFREKMYGAYVTMTVDHAKAGAAFLEATSVATDGFTIVERYNQTVSATSDVNVFLICDGSHFEMKNAYLIPSQVQEIPDFDAASIEVTGYPVTVPLGEEDYWGGAVATVTFEDGFVTTVPREDLALVEPDMSTTGTKTVAFSYNRTKLGNVGKAVVGYYNFEVTDLASIAVTRLPFTTTYYVYDAPVPFYTGGLEVTGTKGDGSTVILDNSALVFGQVQPVEGEQEVEIDFSGVKTSCKVLVKKGVEAVGAMDFTNGWWTTFLSADRPVAAGESTTIHMFLYSDNLESWHSPCTILRGAALNEYAVVRMDNFGWGAGYDGIAASECDWNFDTFAANQNMSAVSITVTNNGDGTADIQYNVTYATGETHLQRYTGIAVDSADLQVSIVTEESCLIILEQAAVDAKLVGISADVNAYVIGGCLHLTLSQEAICVNAVYSDGSRLPLAPDQYTVTYTDDMVYRAFGSAGTTYGDMGAVSYTAPSGEVFTTGFDVKLNASDQPAQSVPVGAEDFSNAWWTTFSNNWDVPQGTVQSVRMCVSSLAQSNWQSPCVILRKADGAEYCVVRMDNYGWGDSYGSAVAACDWNWDNFLMNLSGSVVTISVANNAAGTASIRYHVQYGIGEEHFQYYDNIPVDPADVTFAIVTEESYLVFD